MTSAYNPRSRSEIEAYTDILSLSQIVETLVGQPVDRIIVEYPSYFEHLNSFLTEEDSPYFKAWQL
ncbi:hypothetical protein CL176_04785 [Suicoccus acidiformans]|uniref:Uncharacterized protein n=1 Tax=Suicoccus acidiformans TaxID=2036206 RepID=A0A347WJW3_9LACT|nr:hypothetical protein CL176_04785 [Suicoccus acidiformans]